MLNFDTHLVRSDQNVNQVFQYPKFQNLPILKIIENEMKFELELVDDIQMGLDMNNDQKKSIKKDKYMSKQEFMDLLKKIKQEKILQRYESYFQQLQIQDEADKENKVNSRANTTILRIMMKPIQSITLNLIVSASIQILDEKLRKERDECLEKLQEIFNFPIER